jgi:ATP-dependent RNA helicase DeaD
MTEDQPDDLSSFGTLGLREELLTALTQLGYEEPTPIQREAIPPMLEGRDLLGLAATGTGKTAAFVLPALHRWAGRGRGSGPAVLVLVPTRELAMQVAEAAHKYGRGLGVRVLPVYGGQPIVRQLRALKDGVDLVVATPGRALDHLKRGSLSLAEVQTVVLDEADEMLDMGFQEDLEAILGEAPAERQTVLFSATLPARIAGLARQHLKEPVRIEIRREPMEAGTVPRVRQTAYLVARAYKPAALGRVLDHEAPTAALVFCRTRGEVEQLTETLMGRGYRAEALHGGMSQEQRDRVMNRLRGGTAELLIATDVAARGLDVEHLSHVVNYDVPSAPEQYVHRIGRVGRAGREGIAITLAEPREHRQLRNVEHLTKQKIEIAKLPTIADLRAARMDLTRAALQEQLLGQDSERFRVIVDALSDEFDLMEIAMAAVGLAHEASGGDVDEEEDIPEPRPYEPRGREQARTSGAVRRAQARERGAGRAETPGMTRLWVGAGRSAGVRPQDLVGAIANEAGIPGRSIGAIHITERFALVEVPEDAADQVIGAFRTAALKGKKVTVRRDRGPGG